ncbi:MAG: N-acetylmuramoyl-L-alanine amidase [Eggerthellaceae bacterium]|jgi:uncharacterized protein YjdB/N-acetylmuramoyl-L-alanine amidase|nr:N-acetylmuramoyl-L-alanine amidase [Eggerthellaceae bacterium]MCH4221330.1 N-acetylmuramoyl-L-alanine amidase [Eggerthellaceae bacterium]
MLNKHITGALMVSLALAIFLCVVPASLAASTDESASTGNTSAQAGTNDASTNQAATAATSLTTANTSSSLAATSQGTSDQQRAASDAVSYVYIDQSVVSLGSADPIVIGLSDSTQTMEKAHLTLTRMDNGTTISVDATNTITGAALFEPTFSDRSEAAAYCLTGIDYESQGAQVTIDLTQNASGTSYIFNVVTAAVSDALNQSSDISTDKNVSAFAVDDSNNLVPAANVADALSIADASGTQATSEGDSVVDQEMLDKGITGAEDADTTDTDSASATQSDASLLDGATSLLQSVFGEKEAWAQATAARENYLFVALDPGHGGSDSGAVGYGLQEKDITLSIAQYCRDELNTYSGVSTFLTRNSDEYVGLQERVDRATAAYADVFISIHCNAGGGTGSEVWVPNEASYLYDQTHVVGDELGHQILNQITQLGLTDRGTKFKDCTDGETYPDGSLSDYFSVINGSRWAGIPGIIVEHAFIDTEYDASLLADDSTRQSFGQGDATGIANQYQLVKDSVAQSQSLVRGQGHSSNIGWMSNVYDQKVIGTTGKCQGLEAYNLSLQNAAASAGGIEYRSNVNGSWQGWASNGSTSGTTGQGTALQAVQIRLTGSAASQYDVYYRVHVANVGWLGWASNGSSAGSSGYGYDAQAIEVAIVPKGSAAPGSTATPYKTKVEGISYQAHCSEIGWQGSVSNGEVAGTTGQSLSMQAIKVALDNPSTDGSVQYDAHCADLGWQGWVSDGAEAGTTGQSRQMEAIKIQLTGSMADRYDIYYRVHSSNLGWLDWAENGEVAGSEGCGYAMEAIQIKLVKKGGAAPGSTDHPSYGTSLTYQAHCSNLGWQADASNGEVAGTTGQDRPMEAFLAQIQGSTYSGSIDYDAHCANLGWQGWVSDGAVAGTTGQSRQMEAIKIKLSGDLANNYDIYYRVHSAEVGWLDWAENGEMAGTSGYGYAMQAVQICLVKKGAAAPGSTAQPNKVATLNYAAHCTDIGWQSSVHNGDTAGTTGQNRPMEALQVSLRDQAYSGSIDYDAHCSDIGWQNWVSNGAVAGTTGQSRQMEAIEIKLSGEMADNYDIYYRVHSSEVGWLDWAKNGEEAGTTGYGYAMQAIQIELVAKGGSAPGSTNNPSQDKPTTVTASNAIMGSSQASVAQMVSYYQASGNSYPSDTYASKGAGSIEAFAQIAKEEADAEGVRAEVLFCQAMKETGWLQFGGSVQPSQCNFGGLGATGGSVGGATFADVRTGLRAQVQHLKAYASTDPLNNACVDTRFDYVQRGCAPTLPDLDGRWAVPGVGYGEDIYAMIQKLLTY